MTDEYELQRHAAYFKGWCQAFGEHESLADDGTYWLYGGDQIGMLLPQERGQEPLPELRAAGAHPLLFLGPERVQVGHYTRALPSSTTTSQALERIRELLEAESLTHIYLTSHFMYGPGPKIITLSNKAPLSIIYKVVGAVRVRLF